MIPPGPPPGGPFHFQLKEISMTNYTLHFQNSTGSATHAIKATTPQKALARARRHIGDDSLNLWFEPYDLTSEVNEIVVCDDAGNELACWHDDDTRLRLAAQDLLDALEELVARDQAEAAESGFTDDEMTWLEDARRAIAKAKGGAA
jgi:hypothetical protein